MTSLVLDNWALDQMLHSCPPDMEILGLPWDRNSYPTQSKIKIENSHVLDIHWLYRMPRAIVKADVCEYNDVTKCHGNFITIQWTSAIEVTALLKIHVQK